MSLNLVLPDNWCGSNICADPTKIVFFKSLRKCKKWNKGNFMLKLKTR